VRSRRHRVISGDRSRCGSTHRAESVAEHGKILAEIVELADFRIVEFKFVNDSIRQSGNGC
jgi:hypothetical protein